MNIGSATILDIVSSLRGVKNLGETKMLELTIVTIIALFVMGSWVALRSRVLTAMQNIVANSKTSTLNPAQAQNDGVIDLDDSGVIKRNLMTEFGHLYTPEELAFQRQQQTKRNAA